MKYFGAINDRWCQASLYNQCDQIILLFKGLGDERNLSESYLENRGCPFDVAVFLTTRVLELKPGHHEIKRMVIGSH